MTRGERTNQTTDSRELSSFSSRHTSEDQGYPFPVLVLLSGFGLLILAASLYLAELWLPAGICCVVGGACMGWLLDKVSEASEAPLEDEE